MAKRVHAFDEFMEGRQTAADIRSKHDLLDQKCKCAVEATAPTVAKTEYTQTQLVRRTKLHNGRTVAFICIGWQDSLDQWQMQAVQQNVRYRASGMTHAEDPPIRT